MHEVSAPPEHEEEVGGASRHEQEPPSPEPSPGREEDQNQEGEQEQGGGSHAEVLQVVEALQPVASGAALGEEGVGKESSVVPHSEDLVAAQQKGRRGQEGEEGPPPKGAFRQEGEEKEGHQHEEVGTGQGEERAEKPRGEGFPGHFAPADQQGRPGEEEEGEGRLQAAGREVQKGDGSQKKGAAPGEPPLPGAPGEGETEEENGQGEGGEEERGDDESPPGGKEEAEGDENPEPEDVGEALHPLHGVEDGAVAV